MVSFGILLRYAVSVAAADWLFSLAILPGLAPWNAAVAPIFALAHALLIALPTAFLLRNMGWRSFVNAVSAGAVLGMVPLGALTLLTANPMGLLLFAFVGGCVGALAWLVLRLQTTVARLLPAHMRPVGGIGVSLAMIGLTVLSTGLIVRQINGPKDLSCHNTTRNGQSSVPILIVAELDLEPAEWPRLRALLAAEAAAQGWSSRAYDGPKRLSGSLCQEPGTQISYRQSLWGDPPDKHLTILVAAPQGGGAWRPAVDGLFAKLSAEWPGALHIKASTPPSKPSPPAAT